MSGAGETLRRVIAALDAVGAEHMVVGSFASTFHGQPRTTQDIDIVVRMGVTQLERFVAALPESDWYVDAETARDALRRHSMFNVIDLDSGWKVDFITLKPGAFAAEEFRRRIEATMLGTRVFLATAEDTLLAKLSWAKASGGSERQMRDVAAIVATVGPALDQRYVDEWAAELGVTSLWQQVLDEVSRESTG
jgi:hypothetical protein